MVSLCFILICWACHKSAAPRVLFSGLGPTEKAQQNAIILAYHNFKICQDSYMNSFWGVFRIPYFFSYTICHSVLRLLSVWEPWQAGNILWMAGNWLVDGWGLFVQQAARLCCWQFLGFWCLGERKRWFPFFLKLGNGSSDLQCLLGSLGRTSGLHSRKMPI